MADHESKQDSPTEEQQAPAPSPEDAAAAVAYWEGAMSNVAIYANHVAVMSNEVGVRLAFAEQAAANAPIWMRSAIVLNDYQAYTLWRELGKTASIQRVSSVVDAGDDDATK